MTVAEKPDSQAETETVDRILSAAEQAFAERGFDGVGMKAISASAGVSQGLLHYHFGTKDRLYERVIGRRATRINDERMALLEAVDWNAHDTLAQVLEAMYRPPLGPAGGEKAYARIFSGLIIGREREQALVKKFYDPTAQAFVDAFAEVLGDASRETAGLCYVLALGALVAFIGRDGRLESLMARSKEMETEERLRHLIIFARGGIDAIVATSGGRA